MCQNLDTYKEKEGLRVEKTYMWYTTCPACAKKYGKNYVVMVNKLIYFVKSRNDIFSFICHYKECFKNC